MEKPSRPVRIRTECSRCGKTFSVDPVHVGKKGRCNQCGEVFLIREPPVPETPAATPTQTSGFCPVCQSPVAGDSEPFPCPGCGTSHHRSCWEYNKGCGMYGCPQAPPTEPLESIEIPASYWGREEKECPACRKVIRAAAVRCQHCGTIFSSARPEDTLEFYQRTAREKNLPVLRRGGILLLVFSVLSCTAPLAALFGTLWYFRHKEEIMHLPRLQASIPRIAVVVAVGQSVLMVVMAVLYALFRS